MARTEISVAAVPAPSKSARPMTEGKMKGDTEAARALIAEVIDGAAPTKKEIRLGRAIRILRLTQNTLTAALSLSIVAFQGQAYSAFSKTQGVAGAWPPAPFVAPTVVLLRRPRRLRLRPVPARRVPVPRPRHHGLGCPARDQPVLGRGHGEDGRLRGLGCGVPLRIQLRQRLGDELGLVELDLFEAGRCVCDRESGRYELSGAGLFGRFPSVILSYLEEG
jgi:hypothetical protein